MWYIKYLGGYIRPSVCMDSIEGWVWPCQCFRCFKVLKLFGFILMEPIPDFVGCESRLCIVNKMRAVVITWQCYISEPEMFLSVCISNKGHISEFTWRYCIRELSCRFQCIIFRTKYKPLWWCDSVSWEFILDWNLFMFKLRPQWYDVKKKKKLYGWPGLETNYLSVMFKLSVYSMPEHTLLYAFPTPDQACPCRH